MKIDLCKEHYSMIVTALKAAEKAAHFPDGKMSSQSVDYMLVIKWLEGRKAAAKKTGEW